MFPDATVVVYLVLACLAFLVFDCRKGVKTRRGRNALLLLHGRTYFQELSFALNIRCGLLINLPWTLD